MKLFFKSPFPKKSDGNMSGTVNILFSVIQVKKKIPYILSINGSYLADCYASATNYQNKMVTLKLTEVSCLLVLAQPGSWQT